MCMYVCMCVVCSVFFVLSLLFGVWWWQSVCAPYFCHFPFRCCKYEWMYNIPLDGTMLCRDFTVRARVCLWVFVCGCLVRSCWSAMRMISIPCLIVWLCTCVSAFVCMCVCIIIAVRVHTYSLYMVYLSRIK